MTIEGIQRFLRRIHSESLERSATIRSPHSGADMLAMYMAVESEWMEYVRPAPDHTTLMFAALSFEEQEQIEEYAEQLINEAQALALRLQDRCPMLLYGAIDGATLYGLERWHKAQYHAMERLRRRWDYGQLIHSHIEQARRWLEEAYGEVVN